MKIIIFQSPPKDKNEMPTGNKVRDLCPLQSIRRLDDTVNGTKPSALNTESELVSLTSNSKQEFGNEKFKALGALVIKRALTSECQLADDHFGKEVDGMDKHEDLPKTGKKSKTIKSMFKKCVKH